MQILGQKTAGKAIYSDKKSNLASKLSSPGPKMRRVLPPGEMLKNIFLDVKTASRRAPGKPRNGKVARDPPPPAIAATAAISLYVHDVKATSGSENGTIFETTMNRKNGKVRRWELQHKMQECARSGDLSGALSLLDLMSPLAILDYNALLHGFIKSGHASVERLRMLFDMLGASGLHSNVWTFNIILNGLCRLGHIESALWFVKEMCRQQYVPSFSSLSRLMKKSLRSNTLETSLSLLDLMLRFGYVPSQSVLCSLISSLSRTSRIAEAYSICSFLLARGFCPSPNSYNPILFTLCKSGEILCALSFFCLLRKKGCACNVYSYTALVLGFCQKRLWKDAHRILEQMQEEGCEPSTVTYTVLAKSLCDGGHVKEALGVLDIMARRGCDADLVIYNVLIRALCCQNMLSEVCELLRAANKKGLSPDCFSFGKVAHAQAFYLDASARGFTGDIVTWNIYLHCLCRDNKSREAALLLRNKIGEGFLPNSEQNIDGALKLLDHFKWPGCGPDLISFNTVLAAACKQGNSLMIQKVLHRMDFAGIDLDSVSISCLSQYFCKMRRLSDCRGVLSYMCSSQSSNRITYNLLLGSLWEEQKDLVRFSRNEPSEMRQSGGKGCS
ncbi:unnamed protein product [Spirodela intermedia]|uniref:Uncharacterized protein n=1 Tax=Spirodela intermedia TaxID=51605 RepID=A0A7I8ISE1_SPIIN|nr:unnamed protein product [Spirodela intermedia]CAA6660675.1 unnamed protein product [Spirodela intermedia]